LSTIIHATSLSLSSTVDLMMIKTTSILTSA
jgi:hypothetical protein